MTSAAPLHANAPDQANAFVQARELNLSSKELADRLHTSLYALVRWVLLRLQILLSPAAQPESPSNAPTVAFTSNGERSKRLYLPLFARGRVPFLPHPRPSLLEEVYSDQLWGDSDLALADILLRRAQPAPTRDVPLDEEISAGKNTYTYDAHTYHTKVPPQGIADVISKYLPNGGVVLDPFAGSGMTGVAARYLGHDVILNELSPAASFIAHNFTRTVDTDDFDAAVAHILDETEDLRRNLYTTQCRECGSDIEELTLYGHTNLSATTAKRRLSSGIIAGGMERTCASTSCAPTATRKSANRD